jgi:hypothetical protein
LTARTVYTVVAVGLVGDGSLRAIPLVDAQAPAAPHTGSGLAPHTGRGSSALSLGFVAAGLILAAASAFLWQRSQPATRRP